jgi:histidine kinase
MVMLVGYGFYRAEEKSIVQSLKQDTAAIADTVEMAFRYHMIKGGSGEVQALLAAFSGLTAIERVRIYDREGEIRFSSTAGEVGVKTELSDPTCRICHEGQTRERGATVTFETGEGSKVFRSVSPITREESCLRCHDGGTELLGVLMIDTSMDHALAVTADFRWATTFLVLSIILVFGILIFLNQAFDYFKVC